MYRSLKNSGQNFVSSSISSKSGFQSAIYSFECESKAA